MEEIYNKYCAIRPVYDFIPDWLMTYPLFKLRTKEDFYTLEQEKYADSEIYTINYELKTKESGYVILNEKKKEVMDHIINIKADEKATEKDKIDRKNRFAKMEQEIIKYEANKQVNKLKVKAIAKNELGLDEETPNQIKKREIREKQLKLKEEYWIDKKQEEIKRIKTEIHELENNILRKETSLNVLKRNLAFCNEKLTQVKKGIFFII